MKILIVDDHAVVRSGLRQLIASQVPEAEFAEAADADSALALLRQQAWDICLLDLNLRGRDGLELLAELQALQPQLPVLVLSMHPEEEYGLRVLRAGARGYLSKDAEPEVLIGALRHVLAGGTFVSPALAEQLALRMHSKQQEPSLDLLSEREAAVLKQLYRGEAIKEIAAQLEVSPKTVSTYRQRILEKFSMKTNAELIQLAQKKRWFE